MKFANLSEEAVETVCVCVVCEISKSKTQPRSRRYLQNLSKAFVACLAALSLIDSFDAVAASNTTPMNNNVTCSNYRPLEKKRKKHDQCRHASSALPNDPPSDLPISNRSQLDIRSFQSAPNIACSNAIVRYNPILGEQSIADLFLTSGEVPMIANKFCYGVGSVEENDRTVRQKNI